MYHLNHLNTFFLQMQKEQRLTAMHISLYTALFHLWNYHRFQMPFQVSRDFLMQISGIGSRNTYAKCLRELHQYGYILYYKANRKYQKAEVSLVLWVPEVNITEQTPAQTTADMGHIMLKIDTLSGADPVRPYTTGIYVLNKLNNTENEKGGKADHFSDTPRPLLEQVQAFFTERNYPQHEAALFYYHYEANGWLQGGKTPIINWQAAAAKWVKNNFKSQLTPAAGLLPAQLHDQSDKNYSEPL